MSRCWENGPTRARCRAREAVERDRVAGAVAQAHSAHAAALQDLGGSMRTFLCKAALPAVWALRGARALTLLPAMHRILNAVRPGLLDPGAAFCGLWIERHLSYQAGLPLLIGDTLRLTGKRLATALRSSAPKGCH